MKRKWIKLHLDILDDPKLAGLPSFICWRFVQLLLVAAEGNGSGELPSLEHVAWRLRLQSDDLHRSLQALSQVGMVSMEGEQWIVTHFKDRQYSESYERVKKYRERHRNAQGNAAEAE